METLTQLLSIKQPIIGGAMYPCSNPELVAAVSNSGGIGIVQPISLTLVHGYDFREGLRYIKQLTDKPIGLNLLIEKSSKKYLEKNQQWLDIALEEGVRFFITALGNPQWVVEKVASYSDARVFHDVTNKHWADKAVNAGVHGLICVNNRAGGHAGDLSPQALHTQLRSFNLPLICAGGIGGPNAYQQALQLGYDGVQIGTRFIASTECSAHPDYKQAILDAVEDDIVLTEKITGVPVAVIKTDYIKKRGVKPGAIAHYLLHNKRTKHLARMFYSIRSIFQLKKSLKQGSDYKEYYQAGKSVAEIKQVHSVNNIFNNLVKRP
jgi:nitronate monooxygenase